MFLPRRGWTDVVFGMTLAEVFLLLLLVVWWATTIEGQEGVNTASVEDVNWKDRATRLANRVDILEREDRELKERIDQLRDMLGASGPTMPELREGFQNRLNEAKRRGSPKCQLNNVVAQVSVVNGIESLILLEDPSNFLDQAARSLLGHAVKGAALTSDPHITEFMNGVRRYYKQRAECRFDYLLAYLTDADYRHARSKFEQVFYVAGIQQKSGDR